MVCTSRIDQLFVSFAFVLNDVFPQIVRQSDQSELHFHLVVGFEPEALESVIEFDVTKNRFWLYRSVAAMVKPAFTCQQPFHLGSVCVVLVVHLYNSPVCRSLIAQPAQRTAGAVLRPVFADS